MEMAPSVGRVASVLVGWRSLEAGYTPALAVPGPVAEACRTWAAEPGALEVAYRALLAALGIVGRR